MEVALEVYNSDEFDDSSAEYVKVNLGINDIKRILYLHKIVKQTNVFQVQDSNNLAIPCFRDYDDPADADEKPAIRELPPEKFRSECMMMEVTAYSVNWSFYRKHGTSLYSTQSVTVNDLLQKFGITELLHIFTDVESIATIDFDGKLTSQAQVC
ncbi:MAG: hypothetical protein U9P37_06935 [Pseudomonadota bacterium]|nr:hypothetical protein [Pseudomonadota bacterium]